jgi:PGF-pre-PGF domain-containing protein/PGF-CTERM protein
MLALLMVTSLFAVAGVGSAADGDPSTYVVKQGSQCWEVEAMGDGSQNVSEFYDYRSPETDPSSNYYSSFGTEHFQENQVSQLFVYNGSEGVSLVMLHDKMRNGPNASTTTFNVSGLPETREWAVEDDDYDGRDDEFHHSATESTIHWKWAKHRSDGAAVRGLEDTANYTAVEIQPGFNEDATYWGDWAYSGDEANKTVAWKLITEPSSNVSVPGNKVELDMNQNVTIEQGSCPDTTSPTADLTAPDTVEEGEQFTFDASGSNDDEGIVSYEWDFDGDGVTDATTTSATIDHNYSQNGTYDATVTVYDDAGNNDTATETVTVVEPDEQPPSADLAVSPSEAEVGQTEVSFDASNSTDNGQIVEYRWDFDGDGTTDRNTSANTTTFTYQSTGEFDATVTVVDAGDNSDTANATVNVSDTTPPVVRADVPDQVVKNTTFDVDGSDSTDNGEIVSYEWDFGDGNNATGAMASHSYADNGTYTVSLTVTDGEGNSNSTSAEVTVTDNDTQSPQAAIDAPDMAQPGESVPFDGSDSSDDGEIVSYEWDFGDGTNASGETTSHSYADNGTYTVTLTVTDGANNTDTATKEITIQEDTSDQPPTADFDWSRTDWDDKIAFDASPSTDDHGIANYTWDLIGNGGEHSYKKTFRKQYVNFGTYDVTLTVEDTNGNTDSITKTVVVDDRTDPKVGISAPSSVQVGQQFTANAVDIWDNGEVVHLCWFVDGKEVGGDFQKSLTRSFDQTGEHTLELRIADASGNDYIAKHTVNVVANSGGGGGGGSGGDTGDDTDTNVDDSGDDIHVDVKNAKGDEPFTVELPTGTEAGDGLAAYESITVTLAQSGDYDMTVRALEEAPADVTAPTVESEGFEPLSYLTIESDVSEETISDAEFTFTIQQSRLDALDADASDVQIYRYDDGSWSAVDTTMIEETDDAVRFRASDAGLSTYVVAIDRPVIELADLSVDRTEISPGDSVDITATLENDGQASDVAAVELGIDGETVDTRDVTVGANGARSITFEQVFEEPGTHTVSVNGQEVEVVVQAEETATPDPTDVPETTPEDGQPGFGVVLAVLALLGAALLARRRR